MCCDETHITFTSDLGLTISADFDPIYSTNIEEESLNRYYWATGQFDEDGFFAIKGIDNNTAEFKINSKLLTRNLETNQMVLKGMYSQTSVAIKIKDFIHYKTK